jgi:hypothetical protein
MPEIKTAADLIDALKSAQEFITHELEQRDCGGEGEYVNEARHALQSVTKAIVFIQGVREVLA